MKRLSNILIVVFAVAVGYSVGRYNVSTGTSRSAEGNPPGVPVSQIIGGKRHVEDVASMSGLAIKEVAKRPNEIETSAVAFPAHSSADWVLARRKADHRFGLLYRICALVPVERDLVCELLTREQCIADIKEKLLGQGVTAQQVDTELAAEEKKRIDLQQQLETQMPEVAEFLAEFKAHPLAALATTEIAQQIEINSGAIDPTQSEGLFSAIAKAELQNPIPEFVASLDLTAHSPAELNQAATALTSRNRQLIPVANKLLNDSQMSAFIDYVDQQLTAVRNAAGNQK